MAAEKRFDDPQAQDIEAHPEHNPPGTDLLRVNRL